MDPGTIGEWFRVLWLVVSGAVTWILYQLQNIRSDVKEQRKADLETLSDLHSQRRADVERRFELAEREQARWCADVDRRFSELSERITKGHDRMNDLIARINGTHRP